ncbi:MAG: hypothetical protein V1715_10805 [bacterium]
MDRKDTQLSKPSEMTFNLYAECPDSERVEFVSYSFDQNPVDDPVSFIINSKERYSVDVKIGYEGINARVSWSNHRLVSFSFSRYRINMNFIPITRIHSIPPQSSSTQSRKRVMCRLKYMT